MQPGSKQQSEFKQSVVRLKGPPSSDEEDNDGLAMRDVRTGVVTRSRSREMQGLRNVGLQQEHLKRRGEAKKESKPE